MFETNRRSGISTSELGLYSDRSEQRCHTSGYGTVVIKQFVVVVMIIITVALIALYVYDVTSSTSILHRPGFETNHLHIFQNIFENPNVTVSSTFGLAASSKNEESTTPTLYMQDRSDTVDCEGATKEDVTWEQEFENENTKSESEMQTMKNFQMKQKLLKQIERRHEIENGERNFFENHAMVYRVRPSSKKMIIGPNEEEMLGDEVDPQPFHFDFKTPYPSSFKRLKYPQLSQYRYPHSSRSIQDIIRYMVHDPANPHRGIKFAGVYLNPKKYDTEETEDLDESLLEDESNASPNSVPLITGDPLYRYKPKHPADVNLLASSNFRFSPLGIQRFSPYNMDSYYYRPSQTGPYFKPSIAELDNTGVYSNNINMVNNSKKRKAKPFSVMLDIYPITDINEYQSKNAVPVRPRPPMEFEDYELRRPMQYIPRFPKNQPVPISQSGRQNFRDEEERQQMILHLNLYPRKKGKSSRTDIIQSLESRWEERQNNSKTIVPPFQMVANKLNDHFIVKDTKLGDKLSSTENNSHPHLGKLNEALKMHLYHKAQNYVTTDKSIVTTMATVHFTTQGSNNSTKDGLPATK